MTPQRSEQQWQLLTVALLVVGYSGYYLCRSNLSVAIPLIAGEWEGAGLASAARGRIILGDIASLGVLAYAIGKFASGPLGDRFGGRVNFLTGMFGAVLFTLAFAAGGTVPWFTLAWLGNRGVQSIGWGGAVKIVSRWFSFSSYARVMAVVSLSFLFGDAIARVFMGWVLSIGFGWRGMFVACAAVLAAIFAACWIFLRGTPGDVGLDEGDAHPGNLFADRPHDEPPLAPGDVMATLLRSRAFRAACTISLGLTLLRETFNTWTPTYLTDVVGASAPGAAAYSALFPVGGGVAVLLAGVLGDRFGRAGRAALLALGPALAGFALLGLGASGVTPMVSVALIGAVGFLLIGSYSYLAGAMSLDFGGKHGAATACGLIDGVGYLGGVLAGGTVARLVDAVGWNQSFVILALVSWASAAAAMLFWRRERHFA